jgi:hypothetical protein
MNERDEFAAIGFAREPIRQQVVDELNAKWARMQATKVLCERCTYRRAVRFDGDPSRVRCLCAFCAENARLDRDIARQRQKAGRR